MPSLTKEEEKLLEDFYWERGKYRNRKLGIDEYKSFITNIIHSREQKLIEKIVEIIDESANSLDENDPNTRIILPVLFFIKKRIKN